MFAIRPLMRRSHDPVAALAKCLSAKATLGKLRPLPKYLSTATQADLQMPQASNGGNMEALHGAHAEERNPSRDLWGAAHPWPRPSFQESMALTPLPGDADHQHGDTERFISRHPAWRPGAELPHNKAHSNGQNGSLPFYSAPGAFGGHVFAQAPLAAVRSVEEEDKQGLGGASSVGRLGIHSIHGVFSGPGHCNRPFVYQVSSIATSRSFWTRLITARQPGQASNKPLGPFSKSEADLPLGDVCFSSITTFKRATARKSQEQEVPSAQSRYALWLSQRNPGEWEECPQVDLDLHNSMFAGAGPGAFPILDMRKVAMEDYNNGRPVTSRRELLYYRLLKPLAVDDVNAHVVCHAFGADRNSMYMIGNHLGYGYRMGTAVSLSYSFFVHVNAEEAVMDTDGWWLLEISWPRVSADRCIQETKIWSPEGRHVATGYQDGIVRASNKSRLAAKL